MKPKPIQMVVNQYDADLKRALRRMLRNYGKMKGVRLSPSELARVMESCLQDQAIDIVGEEN